MVYKSNREKVVIFGTGDIAELAHFYLTNDSSFTVAGFTVDGEYVQANKFCDLPVIAFEEVHKKFPPDQFKMFVALSYAQLNKLRATKYEEAKKKGYKLISYISSKTTIWNNENVGENCFIFEDNTIQPFTWIGNNVTLWSGNHIGHHSKIGDHCFITSHVVISGGVVVDPYSFIGVNSTIRDHVVIRKECVIGAGSLVLKDTEEGGVYIGNPAKLQKGCSSAAIKL
jgi:sugar O-acyltransferase (sialic acid O-acetyltransferase NeuD family)